MRILKYRQSEKKIILIPFPISFLVIEPLNRMASFPKKIQTYLNLHMLRQTTSPSVYEHLNNNPGSFQFLAFRVCKLSPRIWQWLLIWSQGCWILCNYVKSILHPLRRLQWIHTASFLYSFQWYSNPWERKHNFCKQETVKGPRVFEMALLLNK